MATPNQSISERERYHAQISAEIAAQGIVLLENRDCLPFGAYVKTIALFGNGARRTIKGGTGSGDVNVRQIISVEEGLKHSGYKIVTSAWLDEYDSMVTKAKEAYFDNIREDAKHGALAGLFAMMSNPFYDPEFRCLIETELVHYPADMAIYVLARNSGEGADRKLLAGDYFLNKQEKYDITLLSKWYDKFILLLNTGGVIDLSPVKDLPGLGAIVLISQGGSGIGDAVSAVLTGKVTPSGKLTATWAKSYEDYPFSNEFAFLDGDISDSYYKEGIYVGYRYFDTFGKDPAWPFGFGRSYTDFNIDTPSTIIEGNEVILQVTVTNIGERFAGREVVQAYVSAPEEKLDKPYQSLVTFRKTKNLQPGQAQRLTLSFPLTRLCAYDETKAAWILESGDYVLRFGNSSRNTEVAAILNIPNTVITEQCKNLFHNEKMEKCISQKRKITKQYIDVEHITIDISKLTLNKHSYSETFQRINIQTQVSFEDVKSGIATPQELAAQLTSEELVMLCVGAARINLKDFTVIGNFSNDLPGAAGETTALLKNHGIPSATMVDGPAGIRVNPKIYEKDGMYIKNPAEDPILSLILPPDQTTVDLSGTIEKYQYCTALPIATMLAQTWDMALLEQAGKIVGAEMEALGVDLWLAPAMNIQRNPLCGRNFEYFSEDPVLSGLCAAAITKGVQSYPGKGVTIKHLAANNQETNRNYNNAHISERVLREMYLKAFEICVKESQPLTAMTSYSLINGVHAANDRDLLTGVLRQEWGFHGVVMTDWGATSDLHGIEGQKYGPSSSALCIQAGNDLIMPGSQRDVERILAALADGNFELVDLQRCAANILNLLAQIT